MLKKQLALLTLLLGFGFSSQSQVLVALVFGDKLNSPNVEFGLVYGVRIGGFFAGESMFHRETDASKVALVHLVRWLNETGGTLLDVQWSTEHLVSLGAVDLDRADYLDLLHEAVVAEVDHGG